MDAQQRIRQQQCCHITFKRLVGEGVFTPHMSVYDVAGPLAGRTIRSLKELSDVELNALRDVLEGKGTKLHAKLHELADAAGIEDLAAWMQRQAARHESMRWLRGHRPETLPIRAQHRLARLLSARKVKPGARPRYREPQPTLFDT